jgi:hypothetical protein
MAADVFLGGVDGVHIAVDVALGGTCGVRGASGARLVVAFGPGGVGGVRLDNDVAASGACGSREASVGVGGVSGAGGTRMVVAHVGACGMRLAVLAARGVGGVRSVGGARASNSCTYGVRGVSAGVMGRGTRMADCCSGRCLRGTFTWCCCWRRMWR